MTAIALEETPRRGAALKPEHLALPALGLMLFVFFLPLVWFFIAAMAEEGSLAELLSDALAVIGSKAVVSAIIATNWIALVVTLVVLVVAYPVAYVLADARGLAFSLIVSAVVLPYFTSIIVRTYSWMVLLGRNGLVNQALLALGIVDEPLALLYNKLGVVIGMSYVLLPYMVLTLYAAMKGIDRRLIQAAEGLGGSPFYAFRRIYFPLTLHAVVAGSLIVFILAIGFFVTPALMGGPSDVMIAMLIEREIELTVNWQAAAVMSLFLLAVTLVLYAVYYRFADIEKMFGGGR
jgi:putative spermidine/putrescine transport system permease protein